MRVTSRDIAGKTVSGVIARPARNGGPEVVMMLHFDDGTCLEFVSPRGERSLRELAGRRRRNGTESERPQLALAV